MLSRGLKKSLHRKAQRMAPADTWNLRLNAIQGRFWSNKNKFQIHYSSENAHYIEYLEEKQYAGGSTTKINRNKDFILKTYLEIKRDLENHFNGNKMAKTKKFNGKEIPNDGRRETVNNKSKAEYQAIREVN